MEDFDKRRMQICENCEFLIKKIKMCKVCKCIMPLKVKIKCSTCPKGKW